MSIPVMTATARFCRSCSKLFATKESRFGNFAFSTSTRKCKDEDEMNPLKTNPYFEKYSKKISDLQKLTPEEIIKRIAALRDKSVLPLGQSKSKVRSQTSSFTKSKTLEEVVKLDLFAEKSSEEITEIWLGHHTTVKDSIAVVIPAEVYDFIHRTSLEHPTFLLPLPREQGYEFFVSQASGHEFHFTPLINYQAFKENAPECLALSHFTELIQEKDIVVMRGEYNSEVLNIAEAMCLTNQLHRYYGDYDSKRQNLLARFTKAPSEFHHIDLIVELERMVT